MERAWRIVPVPSLVMLNRACKQMLPAARADADRPSVAANPPVSGSFGNACDVLFCYLKEKMGQPFDYRLVDWRFVSRILDENSQRLSRTRAGESDTSTSALKQPLRLAGDALRRRAAENEHRVHQFIFDMQGWLAAPSLFDVRAFLFTIADMTNDGLLPAGRYRTWPITAHQHGDAGPAVSGSKQKVPPHLIAMAIDAFCEAVHERWVELSVDPVPLGSWAEWQINGGSLHPFYDGCGRIARSFGAALLIRGSSLVPLYDAFDQYFEHGNRGTEAFARYVRARIGACRVWLTTEQAARKRSSNES